MLLPPLVYVFSIQFLEKIIQKRYTRELATTYTGETQPLFNGSLRLQDAIRENVDAFLSAKKLIDWGVRVNVTVKTKDGIYLYPQAFENPNADLSVTDSIAIARENFRLLNEGLVRNVDVKIALNTLVSNLLLAICLAVALGVLFVFYRRGLRMSRIADLAKQEMIDRLAIEKRESMVHLDRLESQRIRLSKRIDSMKSELERERQKSSAAEDEMIDELVALEEKINENLQQQDAQLQEINQLKDKIQLYEKKDEHKSRQLVKNSDAVRKRLSTLYKTIVIHDRAIDGFMNLTEEMKIKAEEVIHLLNNDPKRVLIKRKVFGKKNRETVLEVIFAYKGRLYFKYISDSRVKILAIGTKLTQSKDLAFLDKL